MISLSSIVKAKALGDMSRNPDYYRARVETFRRVETDEDRPESLLGEDHSSREEYGAEPEILLSQAVMKSQQIDNEARSKAESLLESATRESREIFANAEKEGYAKGYDEGLLEGRKAAEAIAAEGLQEMEVLGRLLRKERQATFERHQKDVVAVAFELAKKIMKQQAQIDENFVLKMLEDVLHENEGTMKIYLSEYQKTLDLKIDKSISKKIRNSFKEAKVVMLQEEDKIMVETHDGVVDMSLPVQIKQLEAAITEMDT